MSSHPILQIASDLHLEFYTHLKKEERIPFFQTLLTPNPAVDILILAGDIGYPEQQITLDFFKWVCSNWKEVLWILGNHEYYNSRSVYEKKYGATILSMEEKESIAEDSMLRHPNLQVLLNQSYVYPDFPSYRFLGTTLWTEKAPPYNSVNDFKYISLTQKDWERLHSESVQFLTEELEEASRLSQQVIVITHYMPTHTMILPIYKDSPHNHAFAANCDTLMKHPQIRLWICGHSHGHHSIENPCPCILNARGYPREGSIQTYDPSYYISVDSPYELTTDCGDCDESGQSDEYDGL